MHSEPICLNPITGRKVWALRSIPTGRYGDPYDWSAVVVRRHWLDRGRDVMLVQGMTINKRRELGRVFKGIQVRAVEHGKAYRWSREGVRER